MKTIPFFRKTLGMLMISAVGLIISCSDENIGLQEETALITEDAITDYYFEDTDDMAGLVMLADNGTVDGSRLSGDERPVSSNDHRFGCPGVKITIKIHDESTKDVPRGTIVIDFGDGCVDNAGNVRKGKIVINFSGRRFLPGSKVVTTFVGYSVNDIALSGTRTLTNVTGSQATAPKFRVQLVGGKAVWPDGTEATREHCFVREWIRNTNNPSLEAMLIDQCHDADFAAEGVNRRGKAYRVLILEPIMFKRGCPIAVKGVKQYIDVASGKVITIDYGDGECDRKITITIEGNTRTIDVKRG